MPTGDLKGGCVALCVCVNLCKVICHYNACCFLIGPIHMHMTATLALVSSLYQLPTPAHSLSLSPTPLAGLHFVLTEVTAYLFNGIDFKKHPEFLLVQADLATNQPVPALRSLISLRLDTLGGIFSTKREKI